MQFIKQAPDGDVVEARKVVQSWNILTEHNLSETEVLRMFEMNTLNDVNVHWFMQVRVLMKVWFF